MPKEKSVGAIIFSKKDFETKFLLLHYNAGHWDFVKGHVEANEKEEQTFWRELAEETGIQKNEVVLLPDFRERITYFYKKKNETMFKEVIFFLAESNTQKVTLSKEHKDFAWLAFGQALEKVTFANASHALKKAHDLLQQKNLGAFA